MADGSTPAKPVKQHGDRALPTGWPRPTASLERRIERKTGLDGKRQWALVGLAVAGVAVGYVVGVATAPEAPVPSTAVKFVEVPALPATREDTSAAASQPLGSPSTGAGDPIASKLRAVMPEVAADSAPGGKALAYEEALPQDVVMPDRQGRPTLDQAAEPTPPAADPVVPVEEAALPPTISAAPRQTTKALPAMAPAWRRNALAVAPIGEEPVVVVVMDDLGVDPGRTAKTVALEGPLTLSFMTYARDVQAQVDRGRAAGHEIMMHVPMEPSSPEVDPGPNVLLSAMPEAELTTALDWALGQFEGYTGINNHMGSRFTEDADSLAVVMRELKTRGLLFLDSLTSRNSHAGEQAEKAGVPYAVRNVFIDHTDDRAAVRRQLDTTARIAKETGSAIAIGHPRDNTLAELEPWMQGLEAQGIRLVPLSALIAKQHGPTPVAKAKVGPEHAAPRAPEPTPEPAATNTHHP